MQDFKPTRPGLLRSEKFIQLCLRDTLLRDIGEHYHTRFIIPALPSLQEVVSRAQGKNVFRIRGYYFGFSCK